MACTARILGGISLNLLLASSAFAQWGIVNPYTYSYGAGGSAAYGYGYGYGGYGGYGSSTIIESQYRGFADALRAQGDLNQANAAASVRYEQARSLYIENQRKWMDTYLARQRILIARRNREAEERRERARRLAEFRKSRPRDQHRLSPSEFDPTTGYVAWPDILLTDTYAKDRKRLEELLVLQRYTRGKPEIGVELVQVIDRMYERLGDQVRDYLPAQWAAARRFLRELRIEVKRLVAR